MKNFSLLFSTLMIITASCDRLGGGVPSEEELLRQELNAIDWRQVDEYPSVPECEKLDDKSLRQSCFFEYLATTLQQKLTVDTIAGLYPNVDTIQVKVTVFPDSTLKFQPHSNNDSQGYQSHKIDSILQVRISELPKISPAIKRGIPVKTEFTLPVILKTD